MPNPAPTFYPACNLGGGVVGIPFELQTPAKLLDEGRVALCSRFFIDIQTNGEQLALTICVDDVDYAFSTLTGVYIDPVGGGRATIEVDYQVSGRIYSLRLVGCLSIGQVEFFECWTDLDVGKEPQ